MASEDRTIEYKYRIALPRSFEEDEYVLDWFNLNEHCYENKTYPIHNCGRKYLPELGCLWCNRKKVEPRQEEIEVTRQEFKPIEDKYLVGWRTLKSR